jgi:hypothetical protein
MTHLPVRRAPRSDASQRACARGRSWSFGPPVAPSTARYKNDVVTMGTEGTQHAHRRVLRDRGGPPAFEADWRSDRAPAETSRTPRRPAKVDVRSRVCENRPYLLDPAQAFECASAFSEAQNSYRSPEVVAAYSALQMQSDRMFAALTNPDRKEAVRVVFTYVESPYAGAWELIDAVRRDRLLEVSAAASCAYRLHPLLGCEPGGPYDRFRAVHDLLGHVRAGLGFDRQGEYVAWRIQDRQYSGMARVALASELHAEHSLYWTSGTLPEHKACLLEPRLLARARAGTKSAPPTSTLDGVHRLPSRAQRHAGHSCRVVVRDGTPAQRRGPARGRVLQHEAPWR